MRIILDPPEALTFLYEAGLRMQREPGCWSGWQLLLIGVAGGQSLTAAQRRDVTVFTRATLLDRDGMVAIMPDGAVFLMLDGDLDLSALLASLGSIPELPELTIETLCMGHEETCIIGMFRALSEKVASPEATIYPFVGPA